MASATKARVKSLLFIARSASQTLSDRLQRPSFRKKTIRHMSNASHESGHDCNCETDFCLAVLCALLELYIRSRPYTKVMTNKIVKLLVLFHSKHLQTSTNWHVSKKKTFIVWFSPILWTLLSWHSRFPWLKLDCIKLFSQNELHSTLHVPDSRTDQISFLSSSQKLRTLKRNVAACQLVDSSFRSNQFCTVVLFLRKSNHSFQESCE